MRADQGILNENLILFFLANLTGVFGGAFVLVVLEPQTDFYLLLPAFILLGVVAANLVLGLLLDLSKKSIEETAKKCS